MGFIGCLRKPEALNLPVNYCHRLAMQRAVATPIAATP